MGLVEPLRASARMGADELSLCLFRWVHKKAIAEDFGEAFACQHCLRRQSAGCCGCCCSCAFVHAHLKVSEGVCASILVALLTGGDAAIVAAAAAASCCFGACCPFHLLTPATLPSAGSGHSVFRPVCFVFQHLQTDHWM